ncbi:hypothetical protein [Aquimarina sediminis]|uniref:hypothetical protein n=1 Tax=Aquimarina sediminis TaxID=2070536 RepID=UPI000CA04991|nr:hypothetical protein [Aquimarina sediminis]
MNKTMLILIITFISLGCSNNKELSSTHKQSIINNSINYIRKNNTIGMKSCYLVDSKISPMQFDFFFNSKNVDFEKKFGVGYQKKLKNIENDLNNNRIEKHNDLSIKFSSCSESKYVLSFSRMSETYVMCYLSEEGRNISIDEILEKKYKFNSNEYYFFLFEFNNSGNIINVFENSVIFG